MVDKIEGSTHARCPTCGHRVASIFEHIDIECNVDMKADKIAKLLTAAAPDLKPFEITAAWVDEVPRDMPPTLSAISADPTDARCPHGYMDARECKKCMSLPPTPSPQQSEQAGDLIMMIKEIRSHTGCSIKSASNAAKAIIATFPPPARDGREVSNTAIRRALMYVRHARHNDKCKELATIEAILSTLPTAAGADTVCMKCDAEMLRVKACEHIAEGEEGWEKVRNVCPSTMAVGELRDAYEKLLAQQAGADKAEGQLTQLTQLIAECRDALSAAYPYMEGSTFSSQYAKTQVKAQILCCEIALASLVLLGLEVSIIQSIREQPSTIRKAPYDMA